jgi:hypothetical protein
MQRDERLDKRSEERYEKEGCREERGRIREVKRGLRDGGMQRAERLDKKGEKRYEKKRCREERGKENYENERRGCQGRERKRRGL